MCSTLCGIDPVFCLYECYRFLCQNKYLVLSVRCNFLFQCNILQWINVLYFYEHFTYSSNMVLFSVYVKGALANDYLNMLILCLSALVCYRFLCTRVHFWLRYTLSTCPCRHHPRLTQCAAQHCTTRMPRLDSSTGKKINQQLQHGVSHYVIALHSCHSAFRCLLRYNPILWSHSMAMIESNWVPNSEQSRDASKRTL